MICYRLACARDHTFEGWFRDSAAFESQARMGLVTCPQCGETRVDRALMAPAVHTRGESPKGAPVAEESAAPQATAPALPDAVRAALMRARAEIERTCEDVGDGFAEEMVRMHRGDRERRGVYGQTTAEEREALHDEGIEFGVLPWLPRADG
ncbi:hypothetical protein AA103196_1994 [Ameyamaea chiangmaiensis NBRC 103196]|uniref:DUF1178 family protein n=1 Tax=Ameyamaea chiangmaiensis TaxID=442969 RepID=A0A850PAM4_9PROT|nr:DUF1178 family protein [Ameyamaea chiangmaiensis]MBS4073741.1 DUF1178 family protein [Ameyamaea chiangmaiensis]NVN39993.1 DUF1178 family protein [Ameyamaea chiangmaiensis]GBQ68619.1 hypothetical protein AA103196_1994 [Ameyamaea chiangmaiensis NBRC 103196]